MCIIFLLRAAAEAPPAIGHSIQTSSRRSSPSQNKERTPDVGKLQEILGLLSAPLIQPQSRPHPSVPKSRAPPQLRRKHRQHQPQGGTPSRGDPSARQRVDSNQPHKNNPSKGTHSDALGGPKSTLPRHRRRQRTERTRSTLPRRRRRQPAGGNLADEEEAPPPSARE